MKIDQFLRESLCREYNVEDLFSEGKKKEDVWFANYMNRVSLETHNKFKALDDEIINMISYGDDSVLPVLKNFLDINGYKIDPSNIMRRSPETIKCILKKGSAPPIFTLKMYLSSENLIEFVLRQREMEREAKNLMSLLFSHGVGQNFKDFTLNREKYENSYEKLNMKKSKFNSGSGRIIDLTGIRLTEEMINCLCTDKIESMNLKGTDVIDEDVIKIIVLSPYIKHLDLSTHYGSMNFLDGSFLPYLSKLNELKSLVLPSFGEGVSKFFSSIFSLTSLEKLILGDLPIDEEIFKEFNKLTNLKNISLVGDKGIKYLSDCNIEDLTLIKSKVEDLSSFQKLTSLDVSNCKNLNMNSIDMRNLSRICLAGCEIKEDFGIAILSTVIEADFSNTNIKIIPERSNVRILSLHGCRNLSQKEFYKIRNYTQLRSLHLSYCNIKDVRFLSSIHNLHVLNLSGTETFNDSMEIISTLPIIKLDMEDVITITEIGWMNLSRMIDLKNLNLRGCYGLTDKNLNAISCLKLDSLHLEGVPSITDIGIKKQKAKILTLPEKYIELERS